VEPIPSLEILWGRTLSTRSRVLGYANLELWSNRLLNDSGIVHQVINALLSDGAISTVHPGNTSFRVAAGGFEAVTNPSYVFTVQDSERSGC
jgi:hypothetical protein